MIIPEVEFALKDGMKAVLRSPRKEDIPGMLEYLYLSAGETEFLLRYPEECGKYTPEAEKALFDRVNGSDHEAMPVCLVEGRLVGACNIGWSTGIKTRHRASVAIAILRDYWNLGIGTRMMGELIRIAEENENILQMELDFVEGNARARALYEKMGFRITGVKPDAIRLKNGTLLNEYTMIRQVRHPRANAEENACNNMRKEIRMEIDQVTFRLEQKEDYAAVEHLVRESFWNIYRPGCSEHYVIHVLRDDPAFVKELDFVMERDGTLIGQNMFMKTVINADDGREIPVLTMGPICIAPALKRQGFGKRLLDYSLEKAAAMGFGAVLFEGNIGFYGKSGFTYAREFGIRYHDLPEGADDSFFLCKELIPGYLDDVTGVYQTPAGYYVKDADVEEFDKAFPPREKLKLPGQIF